MDATKESEIKREIRMAIAQDPLISVRRLQKRLMERGIVTARGGKLDDMYLLKLVKRINAEQAKDVDEAKIADRMAKTQQRFDLVLQRLFKIAFWEWDFLKDGIPMPSPGEQIYALATIGKMDIALLQAEMDAGIYKRKLGVLEVERRNSPLSPERKRAIITAMTGWGIIPKEETKELNNALPAPTTEPGTV